MTTELVPVDIYDGGNLIAIEFYDVLGSFVIQSVWDENDEQTSENRNIFRKWTYNHLRNKGYSIVQ